MIFYYLTKAWHWVTYMVWIRPYYVEYDRLHALCPHNGERWTHTEICVLCGAVVEPRETELDMELAMFPLETGASNQTEYVTNLRRNK